MDQFDVYELRYVHYKEASRISTLAPLPLDREYRDVVWVRDVAMRDVYLKRLRHHPLFLASGGGVEVREMMMTRPTCFYFKNRFLLLITEILLRVLDALRLARLAATR